jgi:hypothetical protein
MMDDTNGCVNAASRQYLARGWHPVPIPAGAKAPTVPHWPTTDFSDTDLWFPTEARQNIGLILGDRGGGLICVDLDSVEARAFAADFLPPTATGGRLPNSHWFYVCPGIESRKFRAPGNNKPIIEILSTGNQVVVHPSIHPTGAVYRPITGEVAAIEPDELIRCVEDLAEECGWQPRSAKVESVPPTNGVHTPSKESDPAIERRAKAYLARMPPSISGAGGHNALYTAATSLVHGFGLDLETALSLLSVDFNPRCEPPWSESELRHKVQDALTKPHDKPRGWLLNESRTPRPATGNAPARVPQKLNLVSVSAADVVEESVEWLWEGWIPTGCLTVLVSLPGVGKSCLTADLAARLSNGWPMPDGSEGGIGKSLLLNVEDDVSRVTVPRLRLAGAKMSAIEIIRGVADGDGALRSLILDDTCVNAIRDKLIKMRDCRLLVLDPVTQYLGEGIDLHRDNEVRAALGRLVVLAEEFKIAVLIVCHTRKATAEFAIDTILGSRAFSGLARAILHLGFDRDTKGRRILVLSKSSYGATPHGRAFAIVPHQDESKYPIVVWEPDPISGDANEHFADSSRRQSRSGGKADDDSDPESDLLGLLKQDGALSASAIRGKVGYYRRHPGEFGKTLDRLVAEGVLAEEMSEGREGRPTVMYRLAGDPAFDPKLAATEKVKEILRNCESATAAELRRDVWYFKHHRTELDDLLANWLDERVAIATEGKRTKRFSLVNRESLDPQPTIGENWVQTLSESPSTPTKTPEIPEENGDRENRESLNTPVDVNSLDSTLNQTLSTLNPDPGPDEMEVWEP